MLLPRLAGLLDHRKAAFVETFGLAGKREDCPSKEKRVLRQVRNRFEEIKRVPGADRRPRGHGLSDRARYVCGLKRDQPIDELANGSGKGLIDLVRVIGVSWLERGEFNGQTLCGIGESSERKGGCTVIADEGPEGGRDGPTGRGTDSVEVGVFE